VVLVALGHPSGFELEDLDSLGIHEGSERCVDLLRKAIGAHPATWAWVRPLAALLLSSSLVLGGLSSCSQPDPLPPLPEKPELWNLQADALTWAGELPGRMRARFTADSAEGRWRDGSPSGQFFEVIVDVWSADTGLLLAHVVAERAQGAWPAGPLSMEVVDWSAPSIDSSGSLSRVDWQDEKGWSCAGCPLEDLRP
jgi:hypothetical protein